MSDFVLVGDEVLNNLDAMILKEIKALSPTSFVGAVELSDKVKIDKKELGERIIALKKSGKVDIVTRSLCPALPFQTLLPKSG